MINYKFLLLLLVVTFIVFQINEAYSWKVNCSEEVANSGDYPICDYVTEWNDSQKFDDLVYDEILLRADEVHEANGDGEKLRVWQQINQESIDKVSEEYPGLEKWCNDLREWVYEKIRTN